MTTQHPIPVWVKALDPLSQFGLVHTLKQRPLARLLVGLRQLLPSSA